MEWGDEVGLMLRMMPLRAARQLVRMVHGLCYIRNYYTSLIGVSPSMQHIDLIAPKNSWDLYF